MTPFTTRLYMQLLALAAVDLKDIDHTRSMELFKEYDRVRDEAFADEPHSNSN